jgi:hypothetical protein
MLIALVSNGEVSTTWLKPQPLPFYQHNKDFYLEKFQVYFLPLDCLATHSTAVIMKWAGVQHHQSSQA